MNDYIDRLWEQFNAECEEIARQCEEEGYPSHGSNYELRVDNLMESYPELFDFDDKDDGDDEEGLICSLRWLALGGIKAKGLYKTRYLAEKVKRNSCYFNGDDKIIKVTGGYRIMSPWEYDVWRKQK